MLSLLDDIEDEKTEGPLSGLENIATQAIVKAHRIAELLMNPQEASARAAGWKLVARQGTAIMVWRRPDGRFVADYPEKRVEL